jgi:hypothetical protein
MPWLGFEPTIPAFERAKTVHALDRAATVIGFPFRMLFVNSTMLYQFHCSGRNYKLIVSEELETTYLCSGTVRSQPQESIPTVVELGTSSPKHNAVKYLKRGGLTKFLAFCTLELREVVSFTLQSLYFGEHFRIEQMVTTLYIYCYITLSMKFPPSVLA